MRKNFSAQFSWFIIIGILIIFFMIFMINSNYNFKIKEMEFSKFENNKLSPENVIKNNIEFCLQRQSEHALNWALFENGNYEKGTATKYPDFPILLKYDLWFHNFDINNFNREGLKSSMLLYLNDTMPNCLSMLDNFYLELEVDKSLLNFNVLINDKSVEVYMYYPIKLNNSNEIIFLSNFQYIILNVPISQIEDDVNEIVNWFNQYVQNCDGKTDGETEMEWGVPSEVIKTLNIPEVFKRDDLLVIFSKNNSEDFEYFLYYKEDYWRESFYIFKIDGSTLESIEKDRYYNNVVNTFYNEEE